MNPWRYARILSRFVRNGLVREMSFRTNFFVTVASELLWVGMTLVFLKVIFMNTSRVQGWNAYEYLFLVGTHFVITAVAETLFFTNIQRLSELVRNGNLDFVLLKPANTQFLLSFERIDYAALANAFVGLFLCGYSVWKLDVDVSAGAVALFALLLVSGVATVYALMFVFATTSIWLIRQTSVSHLWFYFSSAARYPAEIYRPLARGVLWFFLTFIIPVLIVANLPANIMVRTFNPWLVVYAIVIAGVLVWFSSRWFTWAMRSYRSASS